MNDLAHQHIVHKLNRAARAQTGWRKTMMKLLKRIERRVMDAYQLMANIAYYIGRGNTISNAIHLARNTINWSAR